MRHVYDFHLMICLESASRAEGGNTTPSSLALSKMSPRQLTVMELLQTEKNYVGILHTILKV